MVQKEVCNIKFVHLEDKVIMAWHQLWEILEMNIIDFSLQKSIAYFSFMKFAGTQNLKKYMIPYDFS